MRLRGRTDANQDEIVRTLEAYGATVQRLSALGNGCPDLLVGFRRITHLFEVKDGAKPPSRRMRTPAQIVWQASWQGRRVEVIRSREEALRRIGVLK